MSRRDYLLVAVHNRSWGRTEMAIRVAAELCAAGDVPHFLIHSSLIPLLQDTGFDYLPVSDEMSVLVRLALDSQVRELEPAIIVYFDYLNTCNHLLQLGISEPEFLLAYDCPVASLDTWDSERTGYQFDLFGTSEGSLVLGDAQPRIEQFASIPLRLIPVPIAPCDGKPGKFGCLPNLSPDLDRAWWRGQLGMSDRDQVILFCTSDWQEVRSSNESGRHVSRLLPQLVAEYIRQLGPRVHLVHVGPKSYPLGGILGDHYHWHSPVGRSEFERLVAGSDLVLSPNVSATIIAWAIQFNVPVVVLTNSQMLRTLEEAETVAGGKLSKLVREPLHDALPVYPFALWPLGYYHFLRPLLAENAYCSAFDTMELVNERAVVSACDRLLNDPSARDEMASRQLSYVGQVRQLPTASDLLHGFLGQLPEPGEPKTRRTPRLG
jgi:hypothetical protein